MPVRNRRELLRDLLHGLEQQIFTDYEVVVVDDASDDGSAAEADAAAEGGLPVQVLRLAAPAGAVQARLAGVAVATGDVLAFIDSDCVPAKQWLEAGVAAIDAGADLAQGPTRPARGVGPLERSVWGDAEDGLYPTCNVFYRRAAYARAGGFAPDGAQMLGFRPGWRAKGLGFGEDTLLAWRVRREGTVAYTPDAAVAHHVFPFESHGAVSRAWQTGAFPALVREVPELRGTLLNRRYLLGERAQVWLLAALAAALLRRWPVAAALLVPWVVKHARRVGRGDARWPLRLGAVLALDFVTEAALVTGSVRARTLVL